MVPRNCLGTVDIPITEIPSRELSLWKGTKLKDLRVQQLRDYSLKRRMKAWKRLLGELQLLSGGQSKYQEGVKLRFQWEKKEALWIVEVEVRNQFKGQKQDKT